MESFLEGLKYNTFDYALFIMVVVIILWVVLPGTPKQKEEIKNKVNFKIDFVIH